MGSTVCAYLTSCNTHHRTCLRIIHQKNIPGKFQKDLKNIRVITRTSLVILMDQQSQTKRQTDGQTDRCRQQQYHFSLIGPRGKNWLGNVWELICWEYLSAGLKARSSSPQWVSWKQPISAVELTPSPSPRHLPLLTPLSISKCGMQLPIHSQTSVVALLKFGNGYITSNSHKCQRP